jgi:hypothetical protein
MSLADLSTQKTTNSTGLTLLLLQSTKAAAIRRPIRFGGSGLFPKHKIAKETRAIILINAEAF